MKTISLGCAIVLASCALLFASGQNGRFVQSGFDAFSRGSFGNSASNLYVSRDGRIQTINQWDLNGDGYNDVLIANDHDEDEAPDALIYWNQGDGFKSLLPDLWRRSPLAQVVFSLADPAGAVTRLPALGGGRSIITDLNGDGYPDIVFCNYIHYYPGNRFAYVYWGSRDGYRADRKTELPTLFAAGVAAADLNGDGYPDLVFANEGSEPGLEELYPDRGLNSYIYWGSATGFDPNRRSLLPTRGAHDVAIADVNHDGYPDIAFVNNSPAGKGLQVFFGGAAGYTGKTAQTIALDDPTSLRSGDVNGDGYADLIVSTSAKPLMLGGGFASLREGQAAEHTVDVFLGSAQGISPDHEISLPSLQAHDTVVADLNKDGFADIVIANASDGKSTTVPSYIYWGSAQGFDRQHRTELPTLGASGVAVGDFNGDGFPDLIFANSTDGKTYDVPSYIYWGSSTGYAPYLRSQLQSFGATAANVADLNHDGHPDIVLVNEYSGSFGGIDSNIFWGNPHHYYSTASMSSIPGMGTYGTTAADLNNDGYVDLVMCGSYPNGTYLYWGGPEGFSVDRREVLPVNSTFTSSAADLNHDGYLDLVLAGVVNHKPVGYILWGSANGYSKDKEAMLPLKAKRSVNSRIADLNHDGYLDLIYTDGDNGTMQIFWGGPDGYSEQRTWSAELGIGSSLQLADLNGDGNLDFIIAGLFDPAQRSHNTSSRIYWGTAQGTPSLENPVKLEAYTSIECAVADLNHDGYLDLVFSNYMSDSTRSLPLFIYWGGKDGYSNSRRTDLPAESSAGVQLLDLNGDGYPEIIIHNHQKDAEHTGYSYIYWNGPHGFDRNRRTELPTFGPHYSQRVNPGNLYSRKLEEEYISAPLQIPASSHLSHLAWQGKEPNGSKLKFQVRSASDKEALQKAAWTGPDGQDSFYMQSGTPLHGIDSRDRWIQYRVIFASTDAAAWPVLTQVEFDPQ